MTAFPQLSHADIDNIIAYTSEPKAPAPAAAVGTLCQVQQQLMIAVSNNVILFALVISNA
jgi:3-oxoacyl-[acyl-carrier-protein] synthase III